MGAWGLEVAEASSARELGARAVPAERALLRQQAAQRAAQARAYSGEGHSEEWRFEFSRSYPH